MINLNNETDYFILIDEQGGTFGGGKIYEGAEEVMEQFRHWAEIDDYEDPTLKGWTISDCLAHWDFSIKTYDGRDFVEPLNNLTINI